MQKALSFFMFLLQVKEKMGEKKDKTNEEKSKTPNPKNHLSIWIYFFLSLNL